jgi:iron complex outermembrane receptor protein
MSNILKFGLLASVGLAAVIAPVHAAMAQTTERGARSEELEEVIVTARKREESLQEAPVAVSAITGESIERNRLMRIDDLQRTVPSLVVFVNPGLLGTPTFSLRGLSTIDSIPTNETPVALYVDGVYIARPHGALFSLSDLERVEVLRGPQGTLSGRNATAGSIALYTKRPADHFGVQQKLTYGTFNDFVSRTIIDTGPIGSTGITARLAYLHHQVDGYQHNLLADRAKSPGAINSEAALVALHGEWGGSLTADYKFDLNDGKGLGPSYQVVAASPTFLSFIKNYNPGFELYPEYKKDIKAKIFRMAKDNVQGHSLTIRSDITSNIELKSISGFRLFSSQYPSVVGTYPQLFGNVSATGTAPFSLQNIDISAIAKALIKQRQWSQEFQLTGKSDRLSWVAGLYYFKERSYESYGSAGSVSITILSPTTARYGARGLLDFVNYARSQAAYGQASYTPPVLADKLELTLGGRYTKDRKHLIQMNPAPGSALIPVPRDASRSFSNFSAEGSIKYRWMPDAMTYLRVAQAYRAGGIGARDTTFAPNGYDPEKEISYEFGSKTEFFNNRVRINADIYYTKINNLQVSASFTAAQGCLSSANCSTIINSGSAHYKGVEGEITVLPARGIQLDGHIGYIDPTYDSLRITPLATGEIANLSTTVFSNLAKVTVGALAQYSFPPTSMGNLSVRVSWSYHSTRYFGNQVLPTNFAQTLRDPGHHDVSAQVIFANLREGQLGGPMTLAVYGANLLNRHEVLIGLDAGAYGAQGFGPGRTFGVSVISNF